MAWSALVMQFRELSFSCSLTHAHTHTQLRGCLWSPLQAIRPWHIPTHSKASTHTVQRNSPPNYLVSLGADSSKRTESKRKKGGGWEKEEEEEEKRKKNWELGEERDCSHIKMRPGEKLLLLGESWKGEWTGEEGSEEQSADKKGESAQGHICIFKTDIFFLFLLHRQLFSGGQTREKQTGIRI